MTNTDRLTCDAATRIPTSQLFDMLLDKTIAWHSAPPATHPLAGPQNAPRFDALETMRIIQDELTRRIDPTLEPDY